MMDLMLRRRALLNSKPKVEYAITAESNPGFMAALYNAGISPRAEYITVKEANSWTGSMPSVDNQPFPAFIDYRHFINANIQQTYSNCETVEKYCFTAKETDRFAAIGSKTTTVIIPLGCKLTGAWQIQGRRVNPTIDVIIEDSVPENIGNFQVWSVTIRNIYVPDSVVDVYKTKMALYASKIYPLSEYVE